MADSLKNQTVKGVWWSFLEKYSTQGVSTLVTIVMARILTPSEYGLIGMLAIFMALSQVFIDGGFASALIQRKDRTEKDFSTVFWTNMGVSVTLYTLLFIFAPAIASYYNQDLLVPITRVYCLNLIFSALTAVNRVKLTIALNFKTQLKISLFPVCISGIAGIYCAYHGFGVWAIVIQSNITAILSAVLSFALVRWMPSFIFSKESFRNLFRFGSKLLASQIIHSVYVNLYNVIIGKKYSSADLGLYTRAGQFGQLIGTNLTAVMTRVSFPVLSRIQDDDKQLMGAYRKFIAMVAFIVFPLSLGLCGIARPLIVALLTDKWIGSVIYLQILSFIYPLDGITLVNLNLLYVKGKSNLVLRLEIIKKSIAVAILFVTFRYGITAICIGQVIYGVIALMFNTSNTKKLLNYGFLHQIRDVLPYFICSLAVTALALGLDRLLNNDWVVLAAALILCPILYFGLCYLFKLQAFFEMASILGSNQYCPASLKKFLTKLSEQS